jgi:hypothetical protein
MTTTTTTPPARTGPRPAIEVYRDDGPLARALGAALGRAVALPASALVAAGGVPLLALLAVSGDGASRPAVAVAVAWLVLVAGLSSGRPHRDRMRWAIPPLLRLAEYATILWLAAIAGASTLPAAFTLLCVIAFRHYDLVYRLRHQGVEPPAWVNAVSGGWDGRLVVASVLLVAGVLPAAFWVAAAALAVVLATESIRSWVQYGRAQQPVLYEDEEEEIE